MVDQATMTRFNGSTANGGSTQSSAGSDRSAAGNALDSNSAGMMNSVAGLGESLLSLAELQTRLTAVEIRQNLDSAKSGGTLLAIGSILAISSLPVMMVGVAELLVSELGMKRGYALLSTGTVAIVIAGIGVMVARSWLRKKPFGFPLAGEEFARNVSWLRTILRHSGRLPLHR
jgi:Putative Actinobacterial Holin-X, holin superfamily III